MRRDPEHFSFIPMLDSRLMRVQGRLVRVTAFPQIAFGHLCIDIHMSVILARREGSALYFIQPDVEINDGLFELEFKGVEVICPDDPVVPEILEAWALLSREGSHTCPLAAVAAEKYETSIHTGKLDVSFDRFTNELPWPYYRRKMMHEYSGATFSDSRNRELARKAEALSIDLNKPMVCVHARETKWYDYLGRSSEERVNNRHRCLNIEAFLPAIDWLVKNGWQVVRIGDRFSSPVDHGNLFDLASHPERSGALELFLMMNSRFVICGESGVNEAVTLLGRPALLVGIVDLLGSYPLRVESQLLPRTVIDTEKGHPVSIRERFDKDFSEYPLDMNRFDPKPCDPDQILQAVCSMADEAENGIVESSGQIRIRERILSYADRARTRPIYLKWGLDGDFMGRGRVVDAWIEQQEETVLAISEAVS